MPVDVKSTIAGTFWNMAKKKDVDKITVKDLSEACNIPDRAFITISRIFMMSWNGL